MNEEEFGFNRALTFNADGTMICWLRYDEKRVKTYSLQMYKGMDPEKTENALYPGYYEYKYPKAGEDNSLMSAWSYDIKSHKISKLQVPLDADGYMPRIKMTDDPTRVVVYTMNRHQDQLCLYSVNPRSTVAQLIVKESVPKYVKEEAMEGVKFVGNNILLPSDRSGYMKLYVYNMNGQLLRTIGEGNQQRLHPLVHTLQVLFVSIGLCSGLLIFLLRVPILALLGGTLTETAYKYSLQFMMVLAITTVGTSYQMACDNGIIRGGGDTKFSAKMNIISMWLIVVPFSAMAAFWWKFPPVVVFFLLKWDQLYKIIPVAIRLHSWKWVKKVTRPDTAEG